jgi:hypothetical protein
MKKIKDFITFLFFLLFTLFGLWMTADAQTTYKQEGNVFSSVKTTKTVTPDKTPYTWKDSKSKEYPIYISSTGSCFVIKISSKTGKEYRQYLGPEISEDICKQLGRKYTSKTKTK